MRLLTSLPLLSLPFLVFGLPTRITKRGANDLLVFQFADVLEQLESQFYSQALSKFQASDFTNAGFSQVQIPQQVFTGIQKDESTHESVLKSAITAVGGQSISGCNFDFSSVLTDVKTMASAARLVENVGVGAYLGGAALISDVRLLNAAATVLTVEARHQSLLNLMNGGTGIPQAFDIPLNPSEVLAIAGGFISGCSIPIQANPTLTITNTDPPQAGTLLQFKSDKLNSSTDGLFCQMLAGGAPASITLPLNACNVPSGINGPVAVYITNDAQPIASDIVDRANTTLVAGPTMAFIDAQPDSLGQMIRSTTGGSSSNSQSSSSGSSSGSSSSSSSGSTSTSSSSPQSTSSSSSSSNNSGTGSSALGSMNTGPSPDGNMIVNGATMVSRT